MRTVVSKSEARLAMLETAACIATARKSRHFLAVERILIFDRAAEPRPCLCAAPARWPEVAASLARGGNIVTKPDREDARPRRGKKIATWLFLSRTGKMPDFDSGSRRNRTQL
jgi:hypothetical protein